MKRFIALFGLLVQLLYGVHLVLNDALALIRQLS